MISQKKPSRALCIILPVLLVLLNLYLLKSLLHPLIEGSNFAGSHLGMEGKSSAEMREMITTYTEQYGAIETYIRLKQDNKTFDVDTQHNTGHIFGEVLYKNLGTKGISICDENFNFGCYHGLFTKAVADKGVGVIIELDQRCQESFANSTACQHGIGHGIIEYMGISKLTESLQACDTIQRGALYGCIEGVFMEYNAHKNIVAKSPQNPNGVYGECPSLPQKYRQACYHFLPAVWDRDYQTIGKYCNHISNTEERDSCFNGVGTYLPLFTKFDVELTIKHCEQMPNSQAVNECLVTASWIFYSHPQYKKEAPKICKYATQKTKSLCPTDS